MIDLLDQQMEKSQPANLAATWMTVRTILYRYLLVLKRRWWVAFLTMSIGLAIAGWYAGQMPPSYRSDARMMVSGKITLQEGATYSEELGNFFGTQMELMQSGEVRSRALARVQALRPDLEPVKVKLSVGQQPKTSIFLLTAVAPDPVFAREYLNACMDEYIAAKRAMRSEKSDSTLTALTSELASVEKDLRESREALLNFQAQNNLGYLKEEGNSAGMYLANLNRQYAELKTEYQLLEAKLADFGVARSRAGAAVDWRRLGKQHYRSPELLAGEVSVAVDLWAAAVLLYELLSLESPFPEGTAEAVEASIRSGRVTPVRMVAPEVSDPLALVLDRALAPRPAQRFSSAEQFARALAALSDDRVATPLAVAAVVRGLMGAEPG